MSVVQGRMARFAAALGNSPCAREILNKDWAATPLGSLAEWPMHVQFAVIAALHMPVACALMFGTPAILIYNDAYAALIGARHPAAFGVAGGAAWTDSADCIARFDVEHAPMFDDHFRHAGVCLTVRAKPDLDGYRERSRIWMLSRELMLSCDFNGVVASVNPAALAILGWSDQEMIGKTLADFIHPEDQAGTAAEVAKLASGATTLAFENRYRARDGAYRLLNWTAVPDNGMIHAVARDVTRERTAEESLRQSQKLEAIGQLTGGVAHDFNNVLAVIRTSIDLLRMVQLNEEKRRRYLDAIADAVSRAGKLTAQLLAFARRQALAPQVFNVARNLQSLSEMVASLSGSRVAVRFEPAPGAYFVNADPSQFDTAIVNLAVNARDAMAGAGTLTISVAPVDEVPLVRNHPPIRGEYVAVTVADSGCGIAAEHLAQIFEPFFTTKGVGHGTGLGLSQVFGFSKQSHGEVTVRSRPGEGSAFTMYLPRVAQPEQIAAPAPQAGVVVRGAGARVLIVEDNLEVATAVGSVIDELGYLSQHVTSADAALELLAIDAERFDLVFSDVVMAGMSGIELGQQLRRLYPGLPVVLSSGYSDVLATDTSHHFTLLPKPYALEDLASTIDAAIAGAARGRNTRARTGASHESASAALLELAPADRELFRQAELDALHILDTPAEPAFDDITGLAARYFDAPIALVSLVDADRQWFKSRVGLEASETARDLAFCAHAIEHPDAVMVINDAREDARFADNPLVTGDPNIRFYAGAPLVTGAGHALGTLCVIDRQPRQFSAEQRRMLQALADRVTASIEARTRHLDRPD